MIIVMQAGADEASVQAVVSAIRSRGLSEHLSRGSERVIIGAVGDERVFDPAWFESMAQVEKAIRIVHDWRLVSREVRPQGTVVSANGVRFGDGSLKILAEADAGSLKADNGDGGTVPAAAADADALLFDPFRLNPNPYAPDAAHDSKAAERALARATAACRAAGKAAVVRIRAAAQIEAALSADADMLYLGGEMLADRHLQQLAGSLNLPLVLCKGRGDSVRDWLMAAERTFLRGNPHLILGEAGTLALGGGLRLDIEAIAEAKALSHLPVLADLRHLSRPYLGANLLQQLAQTAGANAVIRPAGAVQAA